MKNRAVMKWQYFDRILTFLFSTPHLLKSVIFRLYIRPVGSMWSGLIWHDGSDSGSTPRSSANSGVPRNPSGFLNLATMESLTTDDSANPFPLLENVHWISLTVNKTVDLIRICVKYVKYRAMNGWYWGKCL